MSDTICALATAPGAGGIAIVRISGGDALSIARRVFFPLGKKGFSPRYMVMGDIRDGREFVDRCLAVYFPGPHSFTGEDVCEIHSHGGEATARRVLHMLLEHGARPAAPGEFTKRAFLAGKLDLTQAEATAQLISAISAQSAKNAALQLSGALREKTESLQSTATDIIAALEAGIEYPEEEEETGAALDTLPVLRALEQEIAGLMETYGQGAMLRDGLRVAIAGRPNVGKSTLLNAILGRDRAITSPFAGTTRDVITEHCTIASLPVIFSDTAGIRETADAIERSGVERSRAAIEQAGAILLLLDAERPLTAEDDSIFALACEKPHLIVLNKMDGVICTDGAAVFARYGENPISIAAGAGENIDGLLREIEKLFPGSEAAEGFAIAEERHFHCLCRARQSFWDAAAALESGVDLDCASIDLAEGWRALGEITGRCVTEDIVDRIFSKFCLGK